MRVWAKALRSPEPLPLTEAPYEESTLFAPSGLIPTAEEKAQMAEPKPGGG
jgi:carbon starvation protein